MWNGKSPLVGEREFDLGNLHRDVGGSCGRREQLGVVSVFPESQNQQPRQPNAADIVSGISGDHLWRVRSEEHTSELQSLMRISYGVFCLKKKITLAH